MPGGKNDTLKKILGGIPFTAELYWLSHQNGAPIQTRFRLKLLQETIGEMVQHATAVRKKAAPGKKVFIFASMHRWIEQTAVTALGLAAEGNDVTFGFYPYGDWFTDVPKFDLRRQNIYALKVLEPAEALIHPTSFLTLRSPYVPLPKQLKDAVEEVSVFDTQYTLQIEDVDTNSPTYKFRYARNLEAAQSVFSYLRANKPDVVVVPNGTILEFGIVYRVARFLNIPTNTYEFSDQHDAFWLGQNTEIMRQDTSAMWNEQKDTSFTETQRKRIHAMFETRQKAKVTENFTRQWQNTPAQGSESVRDQLKLDNRPIVLLPTNVLGDSLTLGRQVFSKTMAEWVSRTILYFIGRPDIQLVIRIHPGEILTREYSMLDVVRKTLPELPEYIHVIGPEEKINTYDLVDITDIGLVYTTTVGLEMALKGIPVIVAGKTHYRGLGFTFDPNSWVDYFKMLGSLLENPTKHHLGKQEIELGWKYAYHFFYTFPLPFPWHIKLVHDYEAHKLDQVFSADGRKKYENSFKYLAGQPIDWGKLNHKG